MGNPKTTIAGYLLVLAAIFTIVGHYLTGQNIGLTDIQNIVGLISGISGVAAITAKDGGH